MMMVRGRWLAELELELWPPPKRMIPPPIDREGAPRRPQILTDRWMLRGSNYVNCNCAYGCPCQFGSPTTHGFCEAAEAISIDEGYFNDVRLDGLCVVMLLKWPGEIAQGNGREQFIIDERA